MSMQVVKVRTSSEAVREAARHIEGRKVTIRDVLAGQNLDIKYEEIYGEKLPIEVKRRLQPDCFNCLRELGYEPLTRHNRLWVNFNRDTELLKPQKLEKCKTQFRVSTIKIETEEGAIVSLALREGCSGGFGKFNDREHAVSTYLGDPDKLQFMFEDGNIVLARMNSLYSDGLDGGTINLRSTAEFWKRTERADRRIKEQAVERMLTNSQLYITGDPEEGSWSGIEVRFPSQHRLILSFGDPGETGALFWIDVTKAGETTRYLIDNGFKPLLLGEADSAYYGQPTTFF